MFKQVSLSALCLSLASIAPAALAQVDTVICNQLTTEVQTAQDDIDAARGRFDNRAKVMDERLGLANTAAQNGEEIAPLWVDVMASRDEMKPLAEDAVRTVNNGFSTMQPYVAANCTTMTKEEVEQRRVQAAKHYQDSLQMLNVLPNDWQERYGRHKRATDPAVCTALDQKHKDADARGKTYSLAHDGLIAAYRKAHLEVNEAIDLERPFAAEWEVLHETRTAALPGVNGYGEVVGAIFGAARENIEQGCVPMTAAGEDAFRKNATDVLLEIRDSKMRLNDLPDNAQTYALQRRESTTARIGIINNTDEILCIHANASEVGKCIIKPRGTKVVELNPGVEAKNTAAVVFKITGGVTWLKDADGNAQAGEMAVCAQRTFDHATGSKVWAIESIVEEDCNAPSIAP